MTAIQTRFSGDIGLHTLCANDGITRILELLAIRARRYVNNYGEEEREVNSFGRNSPDIHRFIRGAYATNKDHQRHYGSCTRRQIDAISKQFLADHQRYVQQACNHFLAISGPAGTGKTITLLQLAYRLIEVEVDVLFLTYNIALVCDIRQMWWHLKSEKIVYGNLDSCSQMFLFGRLWWVINDKKYDSTPDFLVNYEDVYLEQIHYYITNLSAHELRDFKRRDGDLMTYGKVLIDEGQDWDTKEIEVIERLFGSDRILVAQSNSQLVRRSTANNWAHWISPRKEPDASWRLDTSLRQKGNLVDFNLKVAAEFMQPFRLKKKANGGEIIMVSGAFEKSCLDQIIERHKRSQCTPYEMLFLVPDGYPIAQKIDSGVLSLDSLSYIDLSSRELRLTFEKAEDLYVQEKVRFINYKSCRGLEGWTCVCLSLDRFYQELPSWFVPSSQRKDLSEMQHELDTRSFSEQLDRFLFNWLMIPLTRAVDTLVLHFDDPESDLAKRMHKAFISYSEPTIQ
jgi:hypothetical protein